MEACGLDTSSAGVAKFYEEFLDVLVIDKNDLEIDHTEFKREIKVIRTNTVMSGLEDSKLLAEDILRLIWSYSCWEVKNGICVLASSIYTIT